MLEAERGRILRMLILPEFDTRRRQPKVPHVARVVASRVVDNEHGVAITYEVRQGRSGKEWWVSASLDGLRMSNTLHTGNRSTADAWIEAVRSGDVRVGQLVASTATPVSQIRRDVAAVVARGKRGGSEIRELEGRRQDLFRQLDYAGNTTDRALDIRRELDAIGVRISALRGR